MSDYAHHLQKKFANEVSNVFDDEDEEMVGASSSQHDTTAAAANNTSGGMASGWRREMHEIFTDNFYKFKKSCGVDIDSEDGGEGLGLPSSPAVMTTGGGTGGGGSARGGISSDQNRIIDLTRMCILLSRIPLLRDTHSAMEEWNQRENEMNNEDEIDDMIEEEVDEEGDDDEEDEDD
jgi:hypothetical protein